MKSVGVRSDLCIGIGERASPYVRSGVTEAVSSTSREKLRRLTRLCRWVDSAPAFRHLQFARAEVPLPGVMGTLYTHTHHSCLLLMGSKLLLWHWLPCQHGCMYKPRSVVVTVNKSA